MRRPERWRLGLAKVTRDTVGRSSNSWRSTQSGGRWGPTTWSSSSESSPPLSRGGISLHSAGSLASNESVTLRLIQVFQTLHCGTPPLAKPLAHPQTPLTLASLCSRRLKLHID